MLQFVVIAIINSNCFAAIDSNCFPAIDLVKILKMSRVSRYDDIQLSEEGSGGVAKDRPDSGVHRFQTTLSTASAAASAASPLKSGFRSSYQMTIAGGFLDFALFVADVEHLKFILDAGKDDIKYYTLLLILLISSLLIQVMSWLIVTTTKHIVCFG